MITDTTVHLNAGDQPVAKVSQHGDSVWLELSFNEQAHQATIFGTRAQIVSIIEQAYTSCVENSPLESVARESGRLPPEEVDEPLQDDSSSRYDEARMEGLAVRKDSK